MKRKRPRIINIVSYAAKMLTMPVGTTYEYQKRPVSRFVYTYHTIKDFFEIF